MKKNIFICCTEQSGENLCFNILSKLDLNNYNVDGVCGARSEKFLRNKFFDISDFTELQNQISTLKNINEKKTEKKYKRKYFTYYFRKVEQ